MRFVLLCIACVACRPAAARPESRATLVGRASFVGDLPTTNRGSVRLIVRGVAEDVSDTCRSSGEQAFTATYDGELIIDDNNAFSAALYPSGVVTNSGCIVSALRVDHVESVMLEAQLGDVQGRGELRFQNLAAVDGDELVAGAFDELNGDLVFQPVPVSSR